MNKPDIPDKTTPPLGELYPKIDVYEYRGDIKGTCSKCGESVDFDADHQLAIKQAIQRYGSAMVQSFKHRCNNDTHNQAV